ncbi:MAG: NAD-binding protein, partial [Deltaproteobacteria bacterium]|nr:NAD-binding protein [Deltaproteobacteria bacterium]
LKWLFIFLVTEETNDVFPNSSFAQLVVVIIKIGMIGVVGFLGYRFLGALVDELKRNRKMSPEHWNGHVVICNWNSRVPRLIRYLRAEGVPENRRNRPIVVVSASAEAVKESEKSKTIHVVQSRAWDPSGLKEAGIARADSAILMGPEDPELDADATVLRTALAINTFLNNDPEFKKRRTLISVCAELQSEQSHEYIKDLGVTEVVVSEHVGMHLLAQAVLCPGTSFFFNEIFDSAPESNEFYSPDVPFKKHGEPVSFREILEHYRDTTFKDRPVLPLGLRLFKDRSDQSEKGPEVTSRSFTYASRRKILVNPTEEEIKKEGFENFVSRDEVLVISDTDPQDIAQGGGR